MKRPLVKVAGGARKLKSLVARAKRERVFRLKIIVRRVSRPLGVRVERVGIVDECLLLVYAENFQEAQKQHFSRYLS